MLVSLLGAVLLVEILAGVGSAAVSEVSPPDNEAVTDTTPAQSAVLNKSEEPLTPDTVQPSIVHTLAPQSPSDELTGIETKPAMKVEGITISYDPSTPYNRPRRPLTNDTIEPAVIKPVPVPPQTPNEGVGIVGIEATPSPLLTNISEANDPWKPFNSQMHSFNNDYFDRYLMKPVATGYSAVVEEGERRVIRNMLDNLSTPKRVINSILQGKFKGTGRELARFLINSTFGGLGMADVAKYQFGIEKCDVDMGQTLEVWGWTTSRYMLVPFLPPMTVRDTVGFVFDEVFSPINYFFPLPFLGSLAKDTVAYVNNRGLRLETDLNEDEPLYGDSRILYFIQREARLKAAE
jgi:ABC-type transporter lipoprotein component MlaA